MRRVFVLAFALLASSAALAATRVERQGEAILFSGRIDDESTSRFVALLREGGVRRLVIDSPGGLVAPALEMADAVYDSQLDVEVPTSCRSSCANYIFLAGRRKIAGRPGAVAWHGNMHHILYLARTGQGQWSEALMQGARELVRREKAFYAKVGVDGFIAWFGKLPPYDVPDFYSLDAPDMARFGVRDVTVEPGAADSEVHLLQVDAAGLETLRPAE